MRPIIGHSARRSRLPKPASPLSCERQVLGFVETTHSGWLAAVPCRQQPHLFSPAACFVTHQHEASRTLSIDHDISGTLSQEASEPMAVLASPHSHVSFHPRCLAVGGIAAECVIKFGDHHVADQHKQRNDAHYRVAAHNKRGVWKLVGMDLLNHALCIIVKQTVCKGALAAATDRNRTEGH